MKFGVREICDVVLKAKANQKVGDKIFYKNEPVIYFDTLKTSSMEGAATTVYAQGGKGNSRLMAWEGERTVTFTMEDALISPAGFMILSGAGLTDAKDKPLYVHTTEQIQIPKTGANAGKIVLSQVPYINSEEDLIYVMKLDSNGEVSTEPYIYTAETTTDSGTTVATSTLKIKTPGYTAENAPGAGDVVLVDYYVEKKSNAQQIDITPDKFGGNYYLEASTLFRDTSGVDMPAEFIIPNCKIQSNFTFTMASSGDPSAFTFTMDAFPDYTRFDKTKKVLAAIQIIATTDNEEELPRISTDASMFHEEDSNGIIVDKDSSDDEKTDLTNVANGTITVDGKEYKVYTNEQLDLDVTDGEIVIDGVTYTVEPKGNG